MLLWKFFLRQEIQDSNPCAPKVVSSHSWRPTYVHLRVLEFRSHISRQVAWKSMPCLEPGGAMLEGESQTPNQNLSVSLFSNSLKFYKYIHT